jgi:hypothetical protein
MLVPWMTCLAQIVTVRELEGNNSHIRDDRSTPQRGLGEKQLLKLAKIDLQHWTDLERYQWQPIHHRNDY